MQSIKKQLLIIISFLLILPLSGFAGLATYYAEPDTGYLSNVVIDIVQHNGAVWFATGNGLSYSPDGGATWLSYTDQNGLVSPSISALYSIPTATGSRLWVATNHEVLIQESSVGISDGLSYSDDDGQNWTQIDFETPPNDIPYVWGGDRTIYDITGHYDDANPDFDNWLFFTAFAGGFLASHDGGMSWRRIFPSRTDSVQFYTANAQPSLRNRYFSCEADTSHGDTMEVWAGTAGGFFQYVYIEPKDKAFAKYVNDIAISADSNLFYYGGNTGFSRSNTSSKEFISRFDVDGLPGSQITALFEYGRKLFVGTDVDKSDKTSTGLAISDDFGNTFYRYADTVTFFEGLNRQILDFAVMNDRLYMAVEEAGLFVTTDTGRTWTQIFVDSTNMTPANRRNVVNDLNVWGDTLQVGTDSGLVQLYMSPTGNIDSTHNTVFIDASNSGARVMKVKTQLYGGNQVIWTINEPFDVSVGSPVIFRMTSTDTLIYNYNAFNHDIGFLGDTVLILGDYGSRFGSNPTQPTAEFPMYEFYGAIADSIIIDSLSADTLTSLSIKGDTIIVGSQNGFGVSLDRGQSFNITRVNTDPLSADLVLSYTSSLGGIDADWVPAIGVQYGTSDPFARIWASTRPTYSGLPGISVGVAVPRIDTLTNDTVGYARIFGKVFDDYAWNFAFASDTVFAATNGGLLYTTVTSSWVGDTMQFDYNWELLSLTDADGNPLLLSGTPVYAVSVDDNFVWVGTGDRTIRINRSDLSVDRSYYVVDANTPGDEVYAYPVPYSLINNLGVDFHFQVEKQANITLEIYDYAMNLVDRVVDNEPYAPGIYPTEGGGRHTWNGKNMKGEDVASGVYYFKVEYSTGEVRWGKLAVIP